MAHTEPESDCYRALEEWGSGDYGEGRRKGRDRSETRAHLLVLFSDTIAGLNLYSSENVDGLFSSSVMLMIGTDVQRLSLP